MVYLRTNYIAERNNKHNPIKSTLIISPYCNLDAITTWGKQQNRRRLFRSLGQKALGMEGSPRQLRSLPSPLCIAMRCAPLLRTFLRGQGGSNLAWPPEVTRPGRERKWLNSRSCHIHTGLEKTRTERMEMKESDNFKKS